MSDLALQGTATDSQNEWFFGIALERLGYSYEFQYWVGPPYLRGSQLIDFVVYAPPQMIPVQIYGRYWHSGARAAEDALKEADLQRLAPWLAPVVIVWEDECETIAEAIGVIKEKIG